MFERFDDRARRVVVLAQEEARLLNHNYIGTEHILLALVHEGEGVAARSLISLGTSLDSVRSRVNEIIGQGAEAPSGHIPFTPRAKKVLELSLREALQLGHGYIGTEHLLLGIVREGEGVASQVLQRLGVEFSVLRDRILEVLSDEDAGERSRQAQPFGEVWSAEERQALTGLVAGGASPGRSGFEGVARIQDTPLIAFGLLSTVLLLATMVAAIVDRPLTRLTSAGVMAIMGGAVMATLGAADRLLSRGRLAARERLFRWSAVVALVLFAAGTVLIGLNALLS